MPYLQFPVQVGLHCFKSNQVKVSNEYRKEGISLTGNKFT